MEFNQPQVITKIGCQARNGANRLNGAVLQGSHDGSSYTDIMTVEGASDTEMVYIKTGCTEAYKFIRLKRNDNTVLNLDELELYTEIAE